MEALAEASDITIGAGPRSENSGRASLVRNRSGVAVQGRNGSRRSIAPIAKAGVAVGRIKSRHWRENTMKKKTQRAPSAQVILKRFQRDLLQRLRQSSIELDQYAELANCRPDYCGARKLSLGER
jgi:hypothetical protein